jgi:epoxyqueuosine reductase
MADTSKNLNNSLSLTQQRLALIKETLNFEQVEIGPLKAPLTLPFYEKWIHNNYFGTMTYLAENLPQKQNPQILSDRKLNSVISFAQSYFPAVYPSSKNPARTAMYSQNTDYHFWLKDKLIKTIEQLNQLYPTELFLPYVDSGPVLERDHAYQNKLG